MNTLPLELQGLTTIVTTPSIYALGSSVTTAISQLVIGLTLLAVALLRRRRVGRA
jgi:putative spermidine/putrescine transport system permease protein